MSALQKSSLLRLLKLHFKLEAISNGAANCMLAVWQSVLAIYTLCESKYSYIDGARTESQSDLTSN